MSFSRCLRFLPGNSKTALFAVRPLSTATVLLQQSGVKLDSRHGVNIALYEEGKRLRASWDGSSKPSTYHSVWLRHNCQCPRCLNSTNQNCVATYELDPKAAISEANITDKILNLKWSCGHEGYIDLEWLRNHCYSAHTMEAAQENSCPTLVKQGDMPTIDYRELEADEGVWRWLKLVNDKGLCLVTGVPPTTEDGLKLTQKISPNLQETFYGGRTEVKVVDDPVTVSYGTGLLEPHMDVPEYESHPGINILHCLQNDECVTGGESIVIDALAVVEKLRVTHPHHFATLVKVPATFHRIFYKWENPVHMVYRTPHIHLNGRSEIVKLRWAPHHMGPLQVSEEYVEPYYEAYSCLAKSFKYDTEFHIHTRLKPGDALTLNNHRMLHGRTAFKLNGGVRFLNNFALNIDDYKSRFSYLCTKFDPHYVPKNILNHDFSYSTAARV